MTATAVVCKRNGKNFRLADIAWQVGGGGREVWGREKGDAHRQAVRTGSYVYQATEGYLHILPSETPRRGYGRMYHVYDPDQV